MSQERRCPNCGGLVGADAEWCTQCFARLDQGSPESPAVPSSVSQLAVSAEQEASEAVRRHTARPGTSAEGQDQLVRAAGERIVWDCPACGTENPIDSRVCSACNTPFRRMLEEPPPPITVDPGHAATLSLFFPGVGHYVLGRKGEAFARGVIFAFAFITGLVSLAAVRSGSGGLYLLLMVLAFAIAGALYVVTTIDAGRAAERQEPLLQPRVLMYGGVGLMLLTLAVVTIAAMSARS
jgi:hypothetical protein